MKKNIFFQILIFIFIILCCQSETPFELENDSVVVQAYLYANEPVQDIRLTKMLPLDVYEDLKMPPINNADIKLIKDGQSYPLDLSPGDSGYYHYSADDLTVEANDLFTLQINYQGQVIAAETTVPLEPQGVKLSSSTLKVPTIEDIFQGGMDPQDMAVTVTWDNEEEDLFYVTTELLEENPEPIDSPLGGNRFRNITFPPTRRSETIIGPFNLSYYGIYLVKVYRVNQEYDDLYETQDQDSRNLNEPLSNIENGLGIFSAFHSNTDSLFLEVSKY